MNGIRSICSNRINISNNLVNYNKLGLYLILSNKSSIVSNNFDDNGKYGIRLIEPYKPYMVARGKYYMITRGEKFGY